MYDSDANGVVNFREFLTALSTTTRGTTDQKLEWSFNMYDQDKNGYISRAEAVEIIGVSTCSKLGWHQKNAFVQHHRLSISSNSNNLIPNRIRTTNDSIHE